MLEIVLLSYGQRQTRQGNKCVAGTSLEPGVTCQQVTIVTIVKMICRTTTTTIAEVELVGSSQETVIEIVTRLSNVDFLLKERLQRRTLNLLGRCSKDDTLTLLDSHLEIAGYIEVFVGSIATLLLLGVLYAAIPIWSEDELVFLVELHVEVGVSSIHTCLDTIVNGVILPGSGSILMRKLAH